MQKDNLKIRVLIFILLFILIAGCTSPQPHILTLHFTDENNIPVNHASVVVLDSQSIQLHNSTDENGNVLFVLIRTGDYKITLSNLSDGHTCSYIVFTGSDNELFPEKICPTPTPKPKFDPAVSAAQAERDFANTIGNLTHS